jgi:hypothetical protein
MPPTVSKRFFGWGLKVESAAKRLNPSASERILHGIIASGEFNPTQEVLPFTAR